MEDVGLTTAALFVLFGANTILYLCLVSHTYFSSPPPLLEKSDGKQLSKPLAPTLASISELSREVCRLGAILILAWCCEHRPPFAHQNKSHDMDMYWFMAFALAVMSFCNVRKSKGGDILNREQTEEWKGWMQFAFLMYHYFSASEVYNGIRVMITSYVWMTGFGNFSFFYMKEDYSAIRVLQMLWRLNFLVICLCLMMGNTYILYYICPLHTFYFLFTFVVMRILPSTNYAEWAVRFKLLGVALVVYAVWDLDLGLFSAFFAFLGKTPVIGATSGTLWEWYFRSSLDHWSTFLGMIYALNFPLSMLWMKKVEAMPARRQWLIKGSVAVAFCAAFAWWVAVILPQPKLDYNLSNAYFGVPIPVLAYIFWRNLTPTLRTHYLEPLHGLGKITLETYLMQHHVWLTSNAKTVLVLVPDYPRLNILVAGCLYVCVSKELHRLTMSLRGMLMPDKLSTILRNLLAIGVLLGACALVASAVTALNGGLVGILLASSVLGAAAVCFVHVSLTCGGAQALADDAEYGAAASAYDGKLVRPVRFLPAALVVTAAILTVAGFNGGARRPPTAATSVQASGPQDLCVRSVNNGMWTTQVGTCNVGVGEGMTLGYCNSYAWEWVDVPDQCHFHFISAPEMTASLSGKKVLFAGDSIIRFMYYAAIRSLGYPTPEAHDDAASRHNNLTWSSPDGSTQFTFIWAPFIQELIDEVPAYFGDEPATAKAHLMVMGCGLWDALHEHVAKKYGEGVQEFATYLSKLGGSTADGPLKVWVKMTALSEGRLITPDKQKYLTNAAAASFQAAADATALLDNVHGVVDGRAATAQRALDSYDGVHYPDFVYDVMQQLLGNVMEHYGWQGSSGGSGGGGRQRRLWEMSVGALARDAAAAAQSRGQQPEEEGQQQEADAEVRRWRRHLASTPHKVGSMANPYMGALMLLVASIMLFARDAYDGLPELALRLFGGGLRLDWQEAYGPLLAKLGKGPPQRSRGVSPAGVELQQPGVLATGLSNSSHSIDEGAASGEEAAAGGESDTLLNGKRGVRNHR